MVQICSPVLTLTGSDRKRSGRVVKRECRDRALKLMSGRSYLVVKFKVGLDDDRAKKCDNHTTLGSFGKLWAAGDPPEWLILSNNFGGQLGSLQGGSRGGMIP